MRSERERVWESIVSVCVSVCVGAGAVATWQISTVVYRYNDKAFMAINTLAVYTARCCYPLLLLCCCSASARPLLCCCDKLSVVVA